MFTRQLTCPRQVASDQMHRDAPNSTNSPPCMVLQWSTSLEQAQQPDRLIARPHWRGMPQGQSTTTGPTPEWKYADGPGSVSFGPMGFARPVSFLPKSLVLFFHFFIILHSPYAEAPTTLPHTLFVSVISPRPPIGPRHVPLPGRPPRKRPRCCLEGIFPSALPTYPRGDRLGGRSHPHAWGHLPSRHLATRLARVPDFPRLPYKPPPWTIWGRHLYVPSTCRLPYPYGRSQGTVEVCLPRGIRCACLLLPCHGSLLCLPTTGDGCKFGTLEEFVQ